MTTTGPGAPENWVTPLYEKVLQLAGVGQGTTLLDLGCGAGQLSRLAAGRGARVSGIDLDRRQVAQATGLVPEGVFDVGDIMALPYPDARFDAVTCVQSIMHAANPLTALREATRVARPDAPVVITVWGKAEDCQLGVFGSALSGLLPRPGGRGPGGLPPPLSADGRLERLAGLAGLTVVEVGAVSCPLTYPDEESVLRDLFGSGIGRQALQVASPATVRRAVMARLHGYRTAGGGYRLENTFRYLVAVSRTT